MYTRLLNAFKGNNFIHIKNTYIISYLKYLVYFHYLFNFKYFILC